MARSKKTETEVETDQDAVETTTETVTERKVERGGRGFHGAAEDDSGVKRPGLEGRPKDKPKPTFEQPGTNNQSRTVEEETDEN